MKVRDSHSALHRLSVAFTCILAGLLLAGCSFSEAPPPASAMSTQQATVAWTPGSPTATAVVFQLQPTSTPLPTPTPLPTQPPAYGPADFPPQINPLTGLPVVDPALLDRRPVAIKVTNFPRSVRPQWGLSQADHVWEYYLEDGLTRFIGVFYGSDAERVGPVRSGRFFDEHVVRMYKSIFVFAAADPRVLQPWLDSELRSFLVIERPDNCPPLCRIGSDDNYNTLYMDTGLLRQYLAGRGTTNGRQNLDGLQFEHAIPPGGRLVTNLAIQYSHVSYSRWMYDNVSGRYLRDQESQDDLVSEENRTGEKAYTPLTDSVTGSQVGAENVVVLVIPHEYFMNTATTEMVKMNFGREGKAFALRDGYLYEINWYRAAPDTLVSLRYPDGRPFPLKAGKTWFQVVGATSEVAQADGDWSILFHIP